MTEISSTESATQEPSSPAATQHPAFNWIRSEEISSLNITIEQYEHRKTGAMHYHLSSDNPENVFLVAFRTVPMDSTGVAHILEHTALCGSKKYPVRDPFFMMIRRSLNTFMNAFTSSDWTAYPFASKNRKDFGNLLDVYFDAAFFSRLHELDFAQEGHRLEFAEMDNPESELQYKGVVYNEMKGAMSSTNSVLWQTISSHLFPTTTYHYNSGGEPDDIPNLSYQQLVDFYRSHYHPSNAVFMTFGDIPAFEHHEQFEELALSKFDKLDIDIHVDDEQRYQQPVRVEERYAAEEPVDNKTHLVVGWLLGHSTNLAELFEAQLLSSVLMENSASPLLKALETSPLGQSPSPMCGLEDSNKEMSFMAGLEGCAEDCTDAVESLILDTLHDIAKNGVDQKQVDAALHQLELNQREISGDSYPYGLQLILSCLSTALHRGDAIKLMDIDPVLDELRQRAEDPAFIPGLIKKHLLDNPHRVTLTMKPDAGLAAQKVESEKQRLAEIKSQLDDEDSNAIVVQCQALAARQEEVDDPGLLPKVGLDDVPKDIQEPKRYDKQLDAGSLSYYNQGTNGLAYQQIIFPLPNLEDELLEVLPLYTSCLPEFGVGEKDYAEVQTWQSRISGGINCFSSIRSDRDDEQTIKAFLTFSSKSLVRNHNELSSLLAETIAGVRFDETQRLSDLIEQICARKENSITGSGHSLAMGLASSRFSPAAKLSHRFGGLQGIKNLKALRDQLGDESVRSTLMDKLRRIHEQVRTAEKRFLLVGERNAMTRLQDQLNACWSAAPDSSSAMLELPKVRQQTLEAWTTSTQVNFCAKAFPTVPAGHEDNPALTVLAGFLRNGFLHTAIREKGGAYGGGAGQDPGSASFRFFSYRDPRLQETLDDFDRSIEWLLNEEHPPHRLEEAILGVIASMDKSSSPAGEAKQAYYNYLFGRNLEHRMEFRQRVLATRLSDLRAVAERYFDPAKASLGIISNKENVENLPISGLEIINI